MRRASDDPGKGYGGPRRAFGKALSVGLDIIEALERERAPLAFCDLRARVEVSPASFARFLRLLVERGYVVQVEDGGYHLGWRLAQAGQRVLAGNPLRAAAAPHLRQLCEQFNESAESVAFTPRGFVFLERVECDRSVVLRAQPGAVLPYTEGNAIGRLALCLGVDGSACERDDAKARRVRRLGCAQQVQNQGEVFRVAAAVYAGGGPTGCLCLGAPAFRVKAGERRRMQAALLAHAAELSRALGANREPYPVRTATASGRNPG